MKYLFNIDKRMISGLVVFAFLLSGCRPVSDPGLIDLDYSDLVKIRKDINAKNSGVTPAYEKLISQANVYLELLPEKVVDGDIPPTGDPHDFYAIGKYSWPNPDTPDGMPWIRIDCNINPESNGPRFDLARYNQTMDRIKTLSLAWFYSQDEKYARKASELLRVWFLDEETKMNPNFECGSALPGVYNGMYIGIIFGVTLIELVDHVQLLNLSDSWTEQDDMGLKNWFSGYVKWLLESDFGIKEGKAKNNHGSWYAAQVAAYSLYTGEMHHVNSMIELAKKQIDQQVDEDGSLPHELKRDWAYSYSVYGMRAFTTLACCADRIGVDLWNYRTSDGRGLQQAYSFLQPYLLDEKKWAWGVDREGEKTNIAALPIMRWAAKKYNDAGFHKVVEYLESIAPEDAPKVWLTGK
ncbi:MAG: alginate lyase family protein [Bacteroidales bacterium]|jgi:hypothetical protein|nr:alginate lyase family protein [Bacteroidales bacterium]